MVAEIGPKTVPGFWETHARAQMKTALFALISFRKRQHLWSKIQFILYLKFDSINELSTGITLVPSGVLSKKEYARCKFSVKSTDKDYSHFEFCFTW